MERSHTRQQRRGTGFFLSLFHFRWRCSAGDPDSSAAAVAVVLIVFNCFNSVLCLGASCCSWLSDLGWNIMPLLAQGLLLTLIILKLLLACQTFPHVDSGSELPLTYTRDALLSLHPAVSTPPTDLLEAVKVQQARRGRLRRRGRRGGVRQRLR